MIRNMKAFLASSPDISNEQLAQLLDLVGKEKANKALVVTAAIVPYGLNPKPEWAERALAPMRSIVDELIETSLEDPIEIPEDLSQFDFVFVTGGNVFYLAYRLEETVFGEKLKQYIEDGGVYAGSSAGSVVLVDDLKHFQTADDPTKAPRICSGLGLLQEVVVVHANHQKYAPIMKDIVRKYESEGHEVITVNDDHVLLIQGEDKEII